MKLPLLVTLFICLVAGANAQSPNIRKLNGTVTDAGNQAVKNCSIVIMGENAGTVTDKDGKFSLILPISRTVFISLDDHKGPVTLVKVKPGDVVLNIKLDKATRDASTAYLTEYNRNEDFRNQASITIDEPVPTKDIDPNAIYSAVEVAPQFKGGEKGWSDYLAANLKYSERDKESNVQGRVIITMVVERDGSLKNINVVRGISTDCDNEAVRLMKASPKWKPGMMNGKPVRCTYSVPIRFSLNK